MPAPVIEYIAPSAAVSHPSFFPSFDQIHEAVTDSENPQFSITADETSQMSVERIQEQSAVSDLVTSVESSPVVDSVPLLHAVEYIMPESRVPAPLIQEQVFVQGIPRAQVGERIQEQIAETVKKVPQERVQQHPVEQIVRVPVPRVHEQGIVPEIPRGQVVKRIRRKRAHQRTVEQNVRAPVPVQEQSFVPEKPEAQGVEQMAKSLDRLLGASELEKEGGLLE